MAFLEVKDLHANIEGKEILTGLSLNINKGEVHAIMGPNGSGKSTFANVLLGHPKYTITAGDILVKGQSILDLSTDERFKERIIPWFSISNRNFRRRLQPFFKKCIQHFE